MPNCYMRVYRELYTLQCMVNCLNQLKTLIGGSVYVIPVNCEKCRLSHDGWEVKM